MLVVSNRIFLTGGTGYLGGEILSQLLNAGYQVRMLARKPELIQPHTGVEIVEGDLDNAERIAGLMRDCSAVFHCAALVAAWAADPTDFYKINFEGLCNVSRACSDASIGTLIYTSSFFALQPTPPPGAREDTAPPPYGFHLYQQSKMQALKEARRLRAEGFPIVILYPGVIYGPGKRTEGNLVCGLIDDFIAGRIPGLLGGGRQFWSFAFISDVARGHIQALRKSPSGGEFVLGGDNVTLGDFFVLLAGLTGRKAPRMAIPLWLGRMAGGLEFAAARLRRRRPRLTPGAVASMSLDWACDSSRARARLGYTQTPLEEGLRQTLHWMHIPLKDASAG